MWLDVQQFCTRQGTIDIAKPVMHPDMPLY